MTATVIGRRWAAGVLVGVLFTAISACGTTVPVGSNQLGTASGDGLTAPAGTGAAGGGTLTAGGSGSDATGTSGAVGAPGAPGTTGTASGGTAPQSGNGNTTRAGGNGGGATATGPNVPASGPVDIGFLVTKCGNCNLLGSKYVQSSHSEQDILQALVNNMNAGGGFAGHRIVPVWGVEDTASSNWNTMMQSICSTFTQDHHVIAVLGAGFGYSDILGNCLAKAGVVAVDAVRATGVPDDNQLAAHPDYILSQEPALNAYNLAAYTSAVNDGVLNSNTRLGVFNNDCANTARVWQNTIRPYLAAHHVQVVVNYVASCPQGAADIGQGAQEVQDAVLKMRAKGVTAVAITDVPLVVFAENAESQHWYPKYLATEGAASYEPYVPSDQLRNIHSAGWEPDWDLDVRHQPPLSTAQKTCLTALSRGGLTGLQVSEYYTYFGLCGNVDLYAQAARAAGNLSTAGVVRAINAMKSSFVSPITLNGQTSFSSSKHAAAVDSRSEAYDTGCGCFAYHGPVRQLQPTG